MRKRLVNILLVLILILLVGCNNESTTNTTNETNTTNDVNNTVENNTSSTARKEERTLEGLKEAFAEAGFEVGENQTLAYEMLYANEGMKFTLDGELIEIYYYDLDNLSEEAKEIIESAKQGSINFSGFNIPVKYKDGFMLVRYDEHSQRDKIIEVFNSY